MKIKHGIIPDDYYDRQTRKHTERVDYVRCPVCGLPYPTDGTECPHCESEENKSEK